MHWNVIESYAGLMRPEALQAQCIRTHAQQYNDVQRKANQSNVEQCSPVKCGSRSTSSAHATGSNPTNSGIPGTSRPRTRPRAPQGEPKTGPKGTQEQ
eukprot:3141302-Pyramimonas_sp.AAC.1